MSNETKQEAYLGQQFVDGLKQLDMNISHLRELHRAKSLDVSSPYTRNTEDVLKLEFVNKCLDSMKYLKAR
jgi:hypothetical protein